MNGVPSRRMTENCRQTKRPPTQRVKSLLYVLVERQAAAPMRWPTPADVPSVAC
jgi:hypothetical protein